MEEPTDKLVRWESHSPGQLPPHRSEVTLPAQYPRFGTDERIHLLDYWNVIVAHRWTVIAVFVAVVAATTVWTLRQVPIYQATARLQIDKENQNVLSFKDVYQIETASDDTLKTQFEILKSRSLARRVIADLHLDRETEFKGRSPGIVQGYVRWIRSLLPLPRNSSGNDDPLRELVDEYISRLEVEPVRQARVVNVSFTATDPELAARVINAHGKHFIEQNLLFKFEATQQASEFLGTQLVTLKSNLEKSEDRLQQYGRENQILFTEEGRNTATEKLQQLEAEYTRTQADRFAKESFHKLIQDGHGESLPQLMGNELITQLNGRVAELQREDAEIGVTFGPEYPRRLRIKSQIAEVTRSIDQEKQRVVRTVEAEYQAAVQRQELSNKALQEQLQVVNKINQEAIQYNILKREVESNKQIYDGLLTRLKEAGISAGLRASNIRIVDPAEVPDVPIRPRRSLNLAISAVTGLLLGVALAFLQEYMDDSVKSLEDVGRYLNVPSLGVIPKLESVNVGALYGGYGYGYGYGYGAGKRESGGSNKVEKPPLLDLITNDRPGSVVAEAYRSARTSLLLSWPDRPPKTILVTSSLPSEGKTVTAVNLAISLTQTGKKVILVDVDMRKPRIHTIFKASDSRGLSNFLTGSVTLRDVIESTDIPNLYLIPCGIVPPNPGELLLSDRFRNMLGTLQQYFDYVVIDSPPLISVSDARVVGPICDGVVLVVKAMSTSREAARRAAAHLYDSRSHILGAILNDLDVRSRSEYYSYYSSRRNYGPSSDSKSS
jgi:polysaccharide biosynthesis transport protein